MIDREDVTRMVRESGLGGVEDWKAVDALAQAAYAAGAAAAKAKEREACAKVCEDKGLVWKSRHNINPDSAKKAYMASQFIASAIRARGQA